VTKPPSFIVVDAVFASSIFAPAIVCTQHLSILHPVSSSTLGSPVPPLQVRHLRRAKRKTFEQLKRGICFKNSPLFVVGALYHNGRQRCLPLSPAESCFCATNEIQPCLYAAPSTQLNLIQHKSALMGIKKGVEFVVGTT
jgi:hypothetical protein